VCYLKELKSLDENEVLKVKLRELMSQFNSKRPIENKTKSALAKLERPKRGLVGPFLPP
jgi:hypothetical protein